MCGFVLVSFGRCPEATGPASAQHSCKPDVKGSAKVCDWISVLIWLFCVVNRTLKKGGDGELMSLCAGACTMGRRRGER